MDNTLEISIYRKVRFMGKTVFDVAIQLKQDPTRVIQLYSSARKKYDRANDIATRIDMMKDTENELWSLFHQLRTEGNSKDLSDQISEVTQEYLQFKVYE